MGLDESLSRLSGIDTLWTLVQEAKQGPDAAVCAQQDLLKRYGGAVYRYLVVVVKDPNLADDLGQEFALRFVRGDFRNVAPERGRFRDFIKTCVINLVRDHYRRAKLRPIPLDEDVEGPTNHRGRVRQEEFVAAWRNELLNRAWEALKSRQQRST